MRPRRAIELNPRSAPARYRLAMALFHLGKLHDAARTFTETLEADPEYVIACFERVVRANPNDASAHYHLGVNYKRKGLDALAMSALAEALKLDPSDTAAAGSCRICSGSCG